MAVAFNLKGTRRPSADPFTQTAVKEVVFIVDKSGSMAVCRDQVLSGYNEYVDALKRATDLNIRFSATFFDTEVAIGKQSVPIQDVPRLTPARYAPGGCTALYDAIGQTLDALDRRLQGTRDTPVVVIIQTDGHENASREFDQQRIREQIKTLEQRGNWSFVFMGADQDAWDAAAPLGISFDNTLSYASTATGQSILRNADYTLKHLRSDAGQTRSFYTAEPPEEPPSP